MMGGKPRDGQILDGINLVPLLKGSAGLDRDTIFCHFPHYTPATGNTPSTYVRKGDWKLIRFYCEGEDLADRLELYNLKDDLGETRNLAADHPDKVKELNRLIEQHLEEVAALVPGRNTRYDPDALSPQARKRRKPKK
jgi:arylsulfatase A-like enzyme